MEYYFAIRKILIIICGGFVIGFGVYSPVSINVPLIIAGTGLLLAGLPATYKG